MRGLNFDAHTFEGVDHIFAHVRSQVPRQIEVATRVVSVWAYFAVAHLEEEELKLGAGVELVAQGSRVIEGAREYRAWVALKQLAVGVVHPADGAGRALLGALPGHDGPGGE